MRKRSKKGRLEPRNMLSCRAKLPFRKIPSAIQDRRGVSRDSERHCATTSGLRVTLRARVDFAGDLVERRIGTRTDCADGGQTNDHDQR